MPSADLQRFIELLDEQHELARITVSADPLLEIAAITNRVCKQAGGGRALLFENPTGSIFRVATNLFGSRRRTCLALGVSTLDQLTSRLSELLQQIPDPDLSRLDQQIGGLAEFSAWLPSPHSVPAWDINSVRPDLTLFPFLQSWPGDGSASGCPRYITLPQVFTAAPDGSTPNCGMYRCQIHGPRDLAIRWNQGSGAANHLDRYRQHGKPLPVAIALGGPTACLFSAMLPLPGTLDEMAFAGFLQGAPIVTAACRTVPLQVPASAEIVIEGFVEPGETVAEGPFGNHTGLYSPAGQAALMRITAISRQAGAIIPATVVGPPPMEDCWMAKSWERLLLAFLKLFVPAVSDLHFPLEWIFHQSAIISLENPNPAMVRETAQRLWSTPWFGAARLLIFTNSGSAPADLSSVAWKSINLSEFGRDLFSHADGKRWALDTTGGACKLPRIISDPETVQHIDRRWPEYGIPSP